LFLRGLKSRAIAWVTIKRIVALQGASAAVDYRARIYERYNSARFQLNASTDRAILKKRMPHLNQFVARHFPRNRSWRILDIGCGYGTVLDATRRPGYTNMRRVDSSPE